MKQISSRPSGYQTYTYNMAYKPKIMNYTIHKYQKAGNFEMSQRVQILTLQLT